MNQKQKIEHAKQSISRKGPSIETLLFQLVNAVYDNSGFKLRLVLSSPERRKEDTMRVVDYDEVNIDTSGAIISTGNHPFVEKASKALIEKYKDSGDGWVELSAIRSTGIGSNFFTLMVRFVPSFKYEFESLSESFLDLLGSCTVLFDEIGKFKEDSTVDLMSLMKNFENLIYEIKNRVETEGIVDDIEYKIKELFSCS